MSEESGFGLNVAEKFFGLIILIIGILALYYTASTAQALAAYTGLFGFLCIILIALGLVLLIAKTE
jgi:heme/copper-type cytochrome/quinol oxidase subunit 4